MSTAMLSQRFTWAELCHSSRARWALDWIACFVLMVIFRGVLHHRTDGFHQQFSLNDASLQHPHSSQQRVPDTLLAYFSVLLPFLLVSGLSLCMKRRWACLNKAWLGLGMTIAITGCLTELGKNLVGRPRPDFLDRCQPKHGFVASHPTTHYKSSLVDYTVCSTSIHARTLADGFKSFPSGHSSMSFAGLVFLAWFLHGCGTTIIQNSARLSDSREEAAPLDEARHMEEGLPADRVHSEPPLSLSLTSLIIPLMPVMLAACISISRLMDYRHHPTDVLAGAILGTTIGTAVYFVYHRPSNSLKL